MPAGDAHRSPRSDDLVLGQPNLRTTTQAFFCSPAAEYFHQELAYYRADAPFLTVEKCAARCLKLSELLTATLARSDRP
jgi:hypothetical protein